MIIKTINEDQPQRFEELVNSLIKEGWEIKDIKITDYAFPVFQGGRHFQESGAAYNAILIKEKR